MVKNDLLFGTKLPLLDLHSLEGTVLVVAPHPDDETLGCGGAIALLRQLGIPVAVSVVSDGTMSHPNSVAYPAAALKKLREAESLAALDILGVKETAVTFWGIPDSQVNQSIEKELVLDISRYLKDLAPSTVLLPWRNDPHADHRASWQLFTTAASYLDNPPRIIEYPIWDWDTKQRKEFPDSVKGWRLDISEVLPQKKQAIAKYASQISDLIADDPEGFRLSVEMLANFTQPWEIYLEQNMNKPKDSLLPSYFEKMYREDPDPWDFETSDYEAAKYRTTLETLPNSRYRSALEIGGSIGVLTAMLAKKCDSLLSVDVSATAQDKAIARCEDLPVRFRIAQVPQEFPNESFDLILVSEVGYYLSWQDLARTQQLILQSLETGGHLLLVHWTLYAKDYPLTGDEVHDSFLQLNGLQHLKGLRQERYRLDLWKRI